MCIRDRLGSNQPTQRPTKEQFAIGNMVFEAFDLGGHEAARAIWADYLVSVTAVVFVVDATDRERLGLASYELHQLLTTELLVGVPFVVLGNKVDLGTACSEAELRHALGLEGTSGKDAKASELRELGIRPMEVFMCSVVRRSGYGDAFRWLTKYV
jgi:GTP-binding protein SAR1